MVPSRAEVGGATLGGATTSPKPLVELSEILRRFFVFVCQRFCSCVPLEARVPEV